jgi:hypothetical protein
MSSFYPTLIVPLAGAIPKAIFHKVTDLAESLQVGILNPQVAALTLSVSTTKRVGQACS